MFVSSFFLFFYFLFCFVSPKSVYVPHALAFKRSYATKVVFTYMHTSLSPPCPLSPLRMCQCTTLTPSVHLARVFIHSFLTNCPLRMHVTDWPQRPLSAGGPYCLQHNCTNTTHPFWSPGYLSHSDVEGCSFVLCALV